MKPIQSLYINYFKFFADNAPIEIGGNHVLLYGENGSGKSSIYWALYTLLEAVYKTGDETNKYFDIGVESSLTNLHIPDDDKSFIKLLLNNGTEYELAYGKFNYRQFPNAISTAIASDFLNYRFMFKLIDFRHNDEINLFSLFKKEVFPYLKSTKSFSLIHKIKSSNDYNEIWEDLEKGANKVSQFPAPTPISTTTPTSELENAALKKEYAKYYWDFITEVNNLLRDINVTGNEILRENLGYPNIRFELVCVQTNSDNVNFIGDPKILLKIPEYENFKDKVNKPQSFLNEAKLTAIGISIRLSIVDRRADYAEDADFQLLVMDDLLISLDMSNRRKVLDMLLSKYADNYQLFILTHDRSFYNFAQKKIKVEYGKEKEWEMIEMYQDNLSPHPKPYIKKQDNKLKKAEDYFNEHDYPACGLYLRKECEAILDEMLPDKFKFSVKVNSDEHDGSNSKKLNDQIKSLEEFCNYEGIDFQPFKELKIYKDVILNTLAHNDIESPLYSQELKAIIKILKDLARIKRGKKILDSGKDLLVELTDPSIQGQIKLSIRTREGFVLVEEEGKLPRLSNFGKCELLKTNTGTDWIDSKQGYNDIKALIDDYKNQLGINQEYDLLDLIQYRGKPLRDKI